MPTGAGSGGQGSNHPGCCHDGQVRPALDAAPMPAAGPVGAATAAQAATATTAVVASPAASPNTTVATSPCRMLTPFEATSTTVAGAR